MSFFISLAAGACLALGAATPLFAEDLSGKQKVEIEKVVHDYLLSNPEVVRQAIDELGKREKVAEAATREKAVGQHGDKIVNSPNQAVVGNPGGDVTLVEFFDYNCGYCKQFERELKTIDNVTVYLFLYPVLGPDSTSKSRDIWCSKDKAKTWTDWMTAGVKPETGNCDAAALQRNVEFGRKYNITGTPTLIFADGTRAPGAIPAAQVEKQLAAAN